jgi:hypothetical protein
MRVRAMAAGTSIVLAAVLGAGLIVPALAQAHAFGALTYQFPLPLWLYVTAGAVAVAASVPAAALADDRIGARVGANIHRPGRGWLSPALRGLTAVLMVECVVFGIAGAQEFTANPATILVWVDFWVGLGVTSALLGPVWDVINPLRAVGSVIDRLSDPPLVYPRRLGRWPAVAMLLAFGWLELAWPGGAVPSDLALVMLVYLVVQVVGMTLVGSRPWLANAELFTVLSRTLGRASPLEWDVTGADIDWVDAPAAERRIRWRGFVSGAWRDPPLGAGDAGFVVVLLAIVLYDGFGETRRYVTFAQWVYHTLGSSLSGTELRTLTMAACVGGIAAVFTIVVLLLGLREGGVSAAAARYAPTLVPIAAVYFAAHYLLYLVTYCQLTPKVILDPMHTDWVPDYAIWTSFPAGLAWALQIGLIVSGHVVAIFAAHHVAPRRLERPRWSAVWAQAPMIALMIVYTAVGLWILGQTYNAA